MDNELQHKFLDYHAQPPDRVWDRINELLDEEGETNFSERLSNYQTNPPLFIWDNIAASLNENETPVIPFRKRLAKPLRYSTAAACLIAVAVLVSLLINKKTNSEEVAISPGVKQTLSPIPSIPERKSETSSQAANTDTGENLVLGSIRKPNYGKVLPLHARSSTAILNKRSNHVASHNYPISKTDIPSRYIIFSTATGEAFRLSKKLFDLFACSDDNENCKQSIESVQQQIASPAIMASADFPGLLDMLQSMNNQ